MLAALGAYEVSLYRRPKVAVLVTGEELAAPGQELRPGQIRESNSFALRGLVEQCGAELVLWRRTGDTVGELEAALREAVRTADVVITSGGVSAGDFDPVRDVLQSKAEVHFWKVAMKPGKPVMFASFAVTPVFGLPGNPVSVMVAFEVFVRPALLKMGGRSRLNRPVVHAVLEQPYRSPEGRVEFVRAHVRQENGRWPANFQGDQGSGRLSTMIGANALLEIGADITSITVGQEIPARLLHHAEVD
jgi:molybdenum cofactor synthesis domain-containing protein